jgi:hypothetical protein
MPGGAPEVFLHQYKLEKIDEKKNSAGRSRMARLECTVAHMGFPAATLNKNIKKILKKYVRTAHYPNHLKRKNTKL